MLRACLTQHSQLADVEMHTSQQSRERGLRPTHSPEGSPLTSPLGMTCLLSSPAAAASGEFGVTKEIASPCHFLEAISMPTARLEAMLDAT